MVDHFFFLQLWFAHLICREIGNLGTGTHFGDYRVIQCGGPLRVIERFTAAELQIRSPPKVTAAHKFAFQSIAIRSDPGWKRVRLVIGLGTTRMVLPRRRGGTMRTLLHVVRQLSGLAGSSRRDLRFDDMTD